MCIRDSAYYEGGALLPFGGHKGYALAVLAELLSGPLVGAEAYPAVMQRSGILIFAMDAAVFRPKEDYGRALATTLGRIKGVPPATGFGPVMVPGEPEAHMRDQRTRNGIPIPDDTWTAVCGAAKTVGLDLSAKR